MNHLKIILLIFLFINYKVQAQQKNRVEILPGAYQTSEYFNLLKSKRVAVFANHTSTINRTHLIDTLKKSGINVLKIFAPEHGFRGRADAGEKLGNSIDSITQIPIISLYGKKLKPTNFELNDIDILIFDIQDVGVRFYTYISSLQYLIESAIENDKTIIVLDRPNPNGFYVDGPVLEKEFTSFIGMQTVPIVYGMTIGEYAKMLIGEKWIDWKMMRKVDDKISFGEVLGFEKTRNNFKLIVIPCKNYTHKSKYELPIKPSPNLPNMASVYWYPTTCLFEGTVVSEGRGTDFPFCNFGHPTYSKKLFSFTPTSRVGAAAPKFKNQICFGWNVFNSTEFILKELNKQIQLKYLIDAYNLFEHKDSFFLYPKSDLQENYFFNKLAGNSKLMNQLIAKKTAIEIRLSWQKKIIEFKKIRKKYLLYQDFE